MVEGERRSSQWRSRLPLGRTLVASLLGLTLVLGAIAALAVGDLYSTRQDYERSLAETYRLEAVSTQLLAAGLFEIAALVRRDPGAAAARRTARRAFEAQAERARALAQGDPETLRLVGERVEAQQRLRRLAARFARGGRVEPQSVNALLGRTQDAGPQINRRQAERRAEARDATAEETREAIATAGVAGALALGGSLTLIVGLIGSIRRPLDELVGATRRLASGRLEERVDPRGPEELRDLGGAFNRMAEQLGTAQRRVEEERERLAVTVESLGDALVVCEADGTVSAVNPRAEAVVPELSPGTRVDFEESGALPPLAEALAGEVMRDAGERTLSITAARLGGGEREGGVVWTIRDVSERARLERVKTDFVATASHELRSPLTSIKGFVELLSRSPGLGEREREFVEVILGSTDRLVELVNDLLDVARLEAGRMEVHPRLFELAEVVREAARLIEPLTAEKGQAVSLDLPADTPRALADPGHVHQIVTNLLTNAHQYTPEGGHIEVSVRAEGEWLALTVADDGRGMSEEELETAFERFVRSQDASTGTGLGLSIVRSLAELQRGSVEVASEPGSGSRFTVRLPAEAPGALVGTEPRAAIRGRRVLVVDDEPEEASSIAGLLEAFEVEAVTAHSGDEALERLEAEQFDALTLDVLMPGRSGFEVLRALRADPRLRRTPVVVVSVFSRNEALFGEWRLSKPVRGDELADALGAALLAGRTRLLVVGRASLQGELEPALLRLGLEHHWVTGPAAAAEACAQRRFEVALVDAGLRDPRAVLERIDLRGRRVGRAVVLFSAGDDAPGADELGERVPLPEAPQAVLGALSRSAA
jgi:signal transduction histidine kinase/DNA-binding NarL/FixJ family response regulator/HAMP domain-containing protein